MVVALISSYVVYKVMVRQNQESLGTALEIALQEDAHHLITGLEDAKEDTHASVSRPFLIKALHQISINPGSVIDLQNLKLNIDSLLEAGFTAASAYDIHGKELASTGHFIPNLETSFSLTNDTSAIMVWDPISKALFLRITESVLNSDQHKIGSLTTEKNLKDLIRGSMLHRSIGKTGEFMLCEPVMNSSIEMDCLLIRESGGEFKRLPRIVNNQSLPMNFALNGKTGVISAKDYRQIPVVAAYKSLSEYGLGMELKIDEKELYQSSSETLSALIIYFLLLVGAGCIAVYLLVLPTARRLVKSEESSSKSEYELAERVKQLNCLNKVQKGLLELEDVRDVIELVLDCIVAGLSHPSELCISLLINGEEKYSSEMSLGYEIIKTAPITLGDEVLGSLSVYSNNGNILVAAERALIDSVCLSLSDWHSKGQNLERIRHLTHIDPLTSLPNRRYLYERLDLARATSFRSGRCGAVLFIDIDKFKVINDSFGHEFGDELLIEVARRIKHCIRETDVVSRFGGDEFIVLLDALLQDEMEASVEACMVSDKILETLHKRFHINRKDINSSSSIGICVFNGQDSSAEELVRYADIAMYECKNSGRNTRRLYNSSMREKLLDRVTLETELRQALLKNEFVLNYQIQLDYKKIPTGAEALLRWVHPEKGNVPPLEFLPIAEESSLITEIGYWVLDEACRQLAKWSKNERFKELSLSINVSSRQFSEIAFIDNIEILINSYHFNPSNLILELTESLMVNTAAISHDLTRLKAMGIRLSIDDFGTGYSSLSYIQKLPITQIKIDKSFVNEIDLNDTGRNMVKTIIAMSQNFNFEVVAEGVERESQFSFLSECSSKIQFQGFLFGKPMSVEGFEKSLLNY
jgi:diguanylate cyclase (GGDEF)-like protein